MPRRMIERDDERWIVSTTGRRTQYNRDEFSVLFTRVGGGDERRLARYSPLATKSREASLAGLSDDDLWSLLARSQPSWTTPETGYRS